MMGLSVIVTEAGDTFHVVGPGDLARVLRETAGRALSPGEAAQRIDRWIGHPFHEAALRQLAADHLGPPAAGRGASDAADRYQALRRLCERGQLRIVARSLQHIAATGSDAEGPALEEPALGPEA